MAVHGKSKMTLQRLNENKTRGTDSLRSGHRLLCGGVWALALCGQVMAALPDGGISLDRTRYVFMSDKRGLAVTVKNDTTESYLAQMQIRSVDEKSGRAEDGGRQPFLLTPPLHRMGPYASQTFRLIGIKSQTSVLPKDRESVFFISVRMIPALASSDAENADTKSASLKPGLGSKDNGVAMQIVMINNAKLFYRPAGLSADGVVDAAKGLTFTLHNRTLKVKNPSPYYMTFASLRIGNETESKTPDGKPVGEIDSFHMVPPKGEYAYPLPESVSAAAGTPLTWQVIDERGIPTPAKQVSLRVE